MPCVHCAQQDVCELLNVDLLQAVTMHEVDTQDSIAFTHKLHYS